MTKPDWQNYFDEKAATHGASVKASDYYDEASFFMQRRNILRWLGGVSGARVLDAGCGVGAFSEPLVAANIVHGVDFSARSLEYAAARGLKTHVGDLAALPFADGFFDLVLCIGVIQLIDDHRPVLRELARVTRPGGTLLVQTLHRGSLQRKLLALFEKGHKFDRMYAMDDLAADFAACGLGELEFLKLYHPFRFAATGGAGELGDFLCTSFALKGRKIRD
jgi:ubiquinone/menaquinone biosynthesis C-methylase UbiE